MKLKVNINGKNTILTKDELNGYLYKYPEYKDKYYIIEELGE